MDTQFLYVNTPAGWLEVKVQLTVRDTHRITQKASKNMRVNTYYRVVMEAAACQPQLEKERSVKLKRGETITLVVEKLG